MTHDDLVKRAVKWLQNQYGAKLPDGTKYYKSGCGVVVPELVSLATQQPDAIGWYGGNGSILVECKVSRADFRADLKKIHVHAGGAGLYRVYMTPPDLLAADEVPDGWGLIFCHPKKITMQKAPEQNPKRCYVTEQRMMYSLLRRVVVRGQLRRCLSPKWGGDGPTVAETPTPSQETGK